MPTSLAFDPGDALFCAWMEENPNTESSLFVDVDGRSTELIKERFPTLSFETQVDKLEPPLMGDYQNLRIVYLVRNTLWNYSDEVCVKFLQRCALALQRSPHAVLLLNEMASPGRGMFERHVEKRYRRRDVTVMTMHNAKQRTEEEWNDLFAKASPDLIVGPSPSYQQRTAC